MPVNEGRVGVLLVNLGTPDGADTPAVRRYLGQFLSDPRVVELPRAVWLPILYGIVLNTRPSRSAAAYRQIWNTDDDEGPLKTYTRRLCERLAGGFGPSVMVDYAMRYQSPSIEKRLEWLISQGCDRILIVPLYPQYAASTTASVFDEVARVMRARRWQPTLRFVAPYYDRAEYIDALAASLRAHLAALDFEPEVVLASFHGLPKLQIERGDPYKTQCEITHRLLCAAAGMDERRLRLSFQSRFGPAKWIEPYTSDVTTQLAKEGIKRLAVVAPGFSVDCLETIEELGVEIKDLFLSQGGEHFARIPCLNDSDAGVEATRAVIERELGGWL